MRMITILLDSLNRRFLPCYQDSPISLPSFQRLAEKSHVFCNHWAASLPCIPARRDLFTGRMEFLERPWGPLEPFDKTFLCELKNHQVYTHMITDHYHYIESSGEHYCQQFHSWEMIRGQEFDAWAGAVEPTVRQYPTREDYEQRDWGESPRRYGVISSQYEKNKRKFSSDQFPSQKVWNTASQWIDENHQKDQWFLMIESFDPHEPFDCPDEFKEKAGAFHSSVKFDWSSYNQTDEPPEAVDNLKRNYLASLLFMDHCLGRFLEKLDEYDMWDDTMILFTTDHGHMLGEHHYTGKNVMPMYNEIAHIPLFIHLPGQNNSVRRDLLTQTTDLFPTILQSFSVPYEKEKLHGKAIPFENTEDPIHSLHRYALYGVFGQSVNITDGKYTYMRIHHTPENQPLFLYTAVPSTYSCEFQGEQELFSRIEAGKYLKHTNHPVFKVPVSSRGVNKRYLRFNTEDLLFDLESDYLQEKNLAGGELEQKYIALLRDAMQELNAPEEQFVRLGLSPDCGQNS